MEESIRFAKKYLEDILSFFGLNTDVRASCEDEVIELNVPSTHLNGFLIGQRGDTLRAIQFMVSAALKNNEMELTRVNVDVADYKRHQRDQLAEKVQVWIEKVKSTGEDMILEPMNAADRRVVHKTVGDAAGVESTSEGEGRERHTVIRAIAKD
jgi:spoIIIJ-associated protein